MRSFCDLLPSDCPVTAMHVCCDPDPSFGLIMLNRKYLHLATVVLAGLSFLFGRAAEPSSVSVTAKSDRVFPWQLSPEERQRIQELTDEDHQT